MGGVFSDQKIAIALILIIIVLYCSLQNFSNLNKSFFPGNLEIVSSGQISIGKRFQTQEEGFFSHFNPFFLLIATQTFKKL